MSFLAPFGVFVKFLKFESTREIAIVPEERRFPKGYNHMPTHHRKCLCKLPSMFIRVSIIMNNKELSNCCLSY